MRAVTSVTGASADGVQPRQAHLEPAAAGGVRDRDPPRVRLDDPARDGEPEARAAVRTGRAGGGAAPAGVEDALEVVLPEAAAAVDDGEHDVGAVRATGDLHRAVRRGVPDGVDDE